MIGLFLTSLGCPKGFWQKGSQGPKNEDFQKFKKISPDIHPIYYFGISQHNWVIFDFFRLPKRFRSKRVPRAEK